MIFARHAWRVKWTHWDGPAEPGLATTLVKMEK